jgi:hypothetical protein
VRVYEGERAKCRHRGAVEREQPLRHLLARKDRGGRMGVAHERSKGTGLQLAEVHVDALLEGASQLVVAGCKVGPVGVAAQLGELVEEMLVVAGVVAEHDAPDELPPVMGEG